MNQLELLDSEKGEGIKILKVNVDENDEIINRFNLLSVPTMVFVENGGIYNQVSGYRLKEEILYLLK